MISLDLKAIARDMVIDLINIKGWVVIAKRVELIHSSLGFLSCRLIAKDKVHPAVQLLGDDI